MGAGVLKSMDDRDRGGFPHVISVGLEGQTEDGNRFTAHAAIHRLNYPTRHGTLARVVYRYRRLNETDRATVVLSGFDQGSGVFREARTAESRPGMQKLRSNAVVRSDTQRHFLNVGIHPFAKV